MYCVFFYRKILDSYVWWSIYLCIRKYLKVIFFFVKWEFKYKLFIGCMVYVECKWFLRDFVSRFGIVFWVVNLNWKLWLFCI